MCVVYEYKLERRKDGWCKDGCHGDKYIGEALVNMILVASVKVYSV